MLSSARFIVLLINFFSQYHSHIKTPPWGSVLCDFLFISWHYMDFLFLLQTEKENTKCTNLQWNYIRKRMFWVNQAFFLNKMEIFCLELKFCMLFTCIGNKSVFRNHLKMVYGICHEAKKAKMECYHAVERLYILADFTYSLCQLASNGISHWNFFGKRFCQDLIIPHVSGYIRTQQVFKSKITRWGRGKFYRTESMGVKMFAST